MNLSPSTSMPEGTFVINTDLSSIQQGGLYYVTLFQDNIPVTATVIRL